MKKDYYAVARLVAAMLLFGSIGLFVRWIPLSSGVTALARGVIGTVFHFLAACLGKQKPSRKAIRRNLLPLILSGAAIGINWVCLFEAYRYTSIAAATVCYYLAPVIVVITSVFLFREKLTVKTVLSVLAALVGTVLVSGLTAQLGQTGDKQITGVMFAVAAACFYALVVILNRIMKDISPMDRTMAQLFTASIVLLAYVTAEGSWQELSGISVNSVLLLVLVGVVHTGIAYTVYFSCIAGMRSQTVAVLSYIDPASAIVFSALFLGEHLDGRMLAGAILILGAAYVSGRADKGAELVFPD